MNEILTSYSSLSTKDIATEIIYLYNCIILCTL